MARKTLDWLLYMTVLAFARVYRRLGPGVGYRIAATAGDCWFLFFRSRRRIIHRNLEIAFGEGLSKPERTRIGRLCCRHALATVTDVAVRDRLVGPESWKRYCVLDPVLEEALESDHPRGLAILTGHLGSWETGQYLCGLLGTPISPVVRTLDNPYLDSASVALRTRFGGKVIPKQGALLGLRETLRAGGCVGILADQNAPATEYLYRFFGHPAYVHASYATVLARASCDVIFSACLREGFSFRFRFWSRRLEIPSGGALRERARALVHAYHEALEEAVRLHPEQYLWMHKKWKTQPDGLPSPYDDLGRRRRG